MKIIVILLLLLTPISCTETKNDNTYWIDVRTIKEYNEGHLKEAVHIPYQNIAKEIEKVTIDKSAKIKVYCKVGGRASLAEKTLEKMGYKNVSNAGGYKSILKERQKNKLELNSTKKSD
jgi:phage shock protein E